MKAREAKISWVGTKVPAKERPQITCSLDAVSLFRELYSSDEMETKESFYILMLNRANRVLGWHLVSVGGVSATLVDPKIIFCVALNSLACGVILCHNHPSENTEPSKSDIDLTRKLIQAGKILEISVLDHIILAPGNEFYSFADEGEMR